MKNVLAFLFFSLIFWAGKAQNIALTQFENAPFMYNPAMMNAQPEANLRLQYRSQPMVAGISFQSFALSTEYAFWQKQRIQKSKKTIKPTQYADYVRGGLGITLLGESQGGLLRTNGIFLRYNYILPAGKSKVSIAVQTAFLQNKVEINNVVTDNQIATGFLTQNSTTNENFSAFQKSYASTGVGILWYGLNKQQETAYFLGASALHLNRPILSSVGDKASRLPALISLQAGYRWEASSEFALSPTLRWLLEGNTQQGLIGLQSFYKLNKKQDKLLASVFYNTRHNITIGAGYQAKNYALNFTYDLNIGVPNNSEYISKSGAWEISLAYKIQRTFKQPPKIDPIKDKAIAQAKLKAKTDSIAKADFAKLTAEKAKAKIDSISNLEAALTAEKIKVKADSVANIALQNIIINKLEPTQKFDNTQSTKTDSLDVFTDLDSDILYFGLGENNLTELSKQILQRNIELLQKNSKLRVHLIGHTCNTGKPENNLILSRQRAEKVQAILVGKGIAITRIKPMGMGDTKPITDHNTDKNRQQNRRVEILLTEE